MCTMIAEQIAVEGSGRAASGWFTLKAAQVSYDHPFHAPDEHGLGGRVAVELSLASARQLVATIQAVLAEAEARGQL